MSNQNIGVNWKWVSLSITEQHKAAVVLSGLWAEIYAK